MDLAIDDLDILIVDDNPADRKAARRLLETISSWNVEVAGAKTFSEAIHQLETNDIDVVLLDYQLPSKDGLQVLQEIQNRNIKKPVIMLTGEGNEQIAADAMRRGAYDYLSKNDLSPNTLEYSINFVMKKHHKSRRKLDRLDDLKQKAELDSLTGLANRRALEQRLREEVKRARRYGNTLSLMMIDLDQFKPVNDQLGHIAGDELLKKFAKLILENVRETDFVARYGGDEFCVITTETYVDDAEQLARRICRSTKNTLPETIEGNLPISCSVGICQYRSDFESIEEFINEADKAMYQAKNMGGNGIFAIHEQESDES